MLNVRLYVINSVFLLIRLFSCLNVYFFLILLCVNILLVMFVRLEIKFVIGVCCLMR